ncbi:RNA ligase family protein [Niallia circulans]
MNQFYLFDIYDEDTERYIKFDLVEKQAEKLGLNLCPVFYIE